MAANPSRPAGDRPGAPHGDAVGGADAIGAARSIAAVVAAGRPWGEQHARLAPEVVAALGEAGMFRLVAPREVGGWEASPPTQLAVYEELGAADPSAAWCVSNAGVAGRVAAYLDDDARAVVFADPAASYAFSNLVAGTAVPVDGGYRVSGRWSVVSGAAHADWAVLGARIEAPAAAPEVAAGDPGGVPGSVPGSVPGGDLGRGSGGDAVRWMLVPAAELTVERTWADASAMRATGSHTLVVTDAFVPEALAHAWDRPVRADRPLYRLRFTSVTGTSAAAISLGVLRSALAELTAALSQYRSSLDDATPRDWPNVQLTVAELTASSRAAWTGLLDAAESVWAAADPGAGGAAGPDGVHGGGPTAAQRAALFAAADHAVQVSLGGVSRAFVCGTSAVLQRGHVLEQALRDVHGMAVNWERIRRMIFDSGRVLLGQDPRFRAL